MPFRLNRLALTSARCDKPTCRTSRPPGFGAKPERLPTRRAGVSPVIHTGILDCRLRIGGKGDAASVCSWQQCEGAPIPYCRLRAVVHRPVIE